MNCKMLLISRLFLLNFHFLPRDWENYLSLESDRKLDVVRYVTNFYIGYIVVVAGHLKIRISVAAYSHTHEKYLHVHNIKRCMMVAAFSEL